MAEIIVRLHEGTGTGSALVRSWTRSPWGHVDLRFPGLGLVLDVRPSVGLRLCEPHRVPPMGEYHERSYLIPDFRADPAWAAICREQGAPYDWHGACAAGVPWLAREHPEAWFCSEAAWFFLAACGLVPGLRAWRRTPADLFDFVTA